MSGTCIAGRGVDANLRLFAAEPEGADDAARSMAAGRLILQTGPDTISDGLRTSLGPLTWAIVRDHVEEVLLVDDADTLIALRLIWERMKLVVEPSCAVPLAAVLAPAFRARPGLERIGIILSGGNVDLSAQWSGWS